MMSQNNLGMDFIFFHFLGNLEKGHVRNIYFCIITNQIINDYQKWFEKWFFLLMLISYFM
jgi:hypothetical protein